MLTSIQSSFGIVEDGFDNLASSWEEKPVTNIEQNYYISGVGNLNLKFFDTTFLTQGIEYFRPIIRGFIVLLLFFFNYKQILSFIGQDPGMYESARIKAEGGKE